MGKRWNTCWSTCSITMANASDRLKSPPGSGTEFAADTAQLFLPPWQRVRASFCWRTIKRVSFKSTCLATGVPASEAVRWVNLLEAEDLLFHRRDAKDPCCLWLDLTDLGMERMCAHFREIRADRPL